jgi:hypothetical protein
MNIRSDGMSKASLNNTSSSIDGESVSVGTDEGQSKHASFWSQSPLSWNFKELWQWGDSNLPTLQNVGGTQNPMVQ